MKNTNCDQLRANIDQIIVELGLEVGWRTHFAKVLGCHISSINNAINGHRSGPRETYLLEQLEKYLLGLNKYYQKRVLVNTKMH